MDSSSEYLLISEIFLRACDQPVEDRQHFLDEACGHDEGIRSRVEAMLAVDSSSCETLDSPDVDSNVGRMLCQCMTLLDEARIPETLGQYRIIEQIGSGGMGIVFRAEQISLRRPVALKILARHLGIHEKEVKRFIREGRAGGNLCHPGIVTVFDMGSDKGYHYIAQELVESGVTVRNMLNEIKDRRTFPRDYSKEVASIVRDVADALEHMHASGIIHRDIKPSNILLTSNGSPKVTDFGLAKVENALSLSRSGDLSGTPYYMSPEQAGSGDGEIDRRTDVYSLGVTLYEMLTLKRPFKGATSYEVLKKIVNVEAIEPDKVNPQIPRNLSAICVRAMEKNPNLRYQSMAELRDDLSRFLSGDDTHARPRNRWTRLWRRTRTLPLVVTTCVFVLLSTAALILFPMLRDDNVDASFITYLHRGEKAKRIGAIGFDATSARIGDRLRIHVQLDQAAFCYLFALNPDGKIQLCYPGSKKEIPERLETLTFPEESKIFFRLTEKEGTGLQAFVLVCSSDPLPRFDQWISTIDFLSWRRLLGNTVWRFDGEAFLALGTTRGDIELVDAYVDSEKPPGDFEVICTSLMDHPSVNSVFALSFPVFQQD